MLIAALIAVLLGEIGGALARADARNPVFIALTLTVAAVAVSGGLLVAPQLTPWARTLLVGIALGFAGVVQLRAKSAAPPAGPVATLIAIWASSLPLTLFALAAFAESATALGGLLGLVAALILHEHATLLVRRIAGGLLLLAALWLSLAGLRLL